MRSISCTIAIFTLALGSAIAGDGKTLEGTWEIVELTAYGKKVDFNKIKGTKFTFAKDKLTIQPPNDKLEEFVTRTFTFKLDSTKQPAEVELVVVDGKEKGLKSIGIYELKGDTLRWCQSDADKAPERPKEFASPANSPNYLFTLKRAK